MPTEEDGVVISISLGSMKFGNGVGAAKATCADRPKVTMKVPTVPIILQEFFATLRVGIVSSKPGSFVALRDNTARCLECSGAYLEVDDTALSEGPIENALQ